MINRTCRSITRIIACSLAKAIENLTELRLLNRRLITVTRSCSARFGEPKGPTKRHTTWIGSHPFSVSVSNPVAMGWLAPSVCPRLPPVYLRWWPLIRFLVPPVWSSRSFKAPTFDAAQGNRIKKLLTTVDLDHAEGVIIIINVRDAMIDAKFATV